MYFMPVKSAMAHAILLLQQLQFPPFPTGGVEVNVTDLRLVGSAHPTVDRGFRPFARVDFSLFQCHSV